MHIYESGTRLRQANRCILPNCLFPKQNYKKHYFVTLPLNTNRLHLVKVSFVRGRPVSESSMVVHTDQGFRETTILNVKCEGGVGDWGGGCFNNEHNSVLLFLSLVPLWLCQV